MSVSPWLQRHFDSNPQKKKDIKKKLKRIKGDIDPAFQASFKKFKKQLLTIVDENPGCENMVNEELAGLGVGITESNGRYSVKVWASIHDNLSA